MVNKELKLKKSISNKANLYYFMFLANLYTAIGFDWILIGASFFSAISVTLNNFDKVIDEWSNWHYIFSQRLRVLSRKLEFEEAYLSQISQYLTDLELEMESIKPNFINIHFRQHSNFDIKK